MSIQLYRMALRIPKLVREKALQTVCPQDAYVPWDEEVPDTVRSAENHAISERCKGSK